MAKLAITLLVVAITVCQSSASKHHHGHLRNGTIKDDKAYARSYLLNSTASAGGNPRPADSEDYDHIIVVKHVKSNTPEIPSRSTEEGYEDKEPDFDHTIVVKNTAKPTSTEETHPAAPVPVAVAPVADAAGSAGAAPTVLPVAQDVQSTAKPSFADVVATPASSATSTNESVPVSSSSAGLNHSPPSAAQHDSHKTPITREGGSKKDDYASLLLKIENYTKGMGEMDAFDKDTKSDCETEYKLQEGKDVALSQVFDELFGEGKVPVETASRGFINADHSRFESEDGSFTVSSCDDKGSIKVQNLVSVSSVTPVKWMELRHVRIKTIEFFYEEMAERKEGTPWNRMAISGSGNAYLGPTKQEGFIKFDKSLTDSTGKAGDTDVNVSIQFNNEEYKDTVQASLFLSIFAQSLSALYPDPPQMEISRLGLESLAFNRKAPKTHMIKAIVSEANQYTASITGEVTGSNLLSNTKELYIVCQNDFSVIVNNVNCAILGTLDVASFDFNSIVNDIELTDLAKDVKLFRGGKLPETIFFQSSRVVMDSINANDIQYVIDPFVTNEKKRDSDIGEQPSIIANTCFRYHLSNIGQQFSSINNTDGKDMLVNMCPGMDSIKFYLPDIGILPVAQMPSLITDSETEVSSYEKLFGDQNMEVELIEVVKSDIGAGFKFVITMKQRMTDDMGGFHFLPKLPFLEISQSAIRMIVQKNKRIELEGCGDENILKSIANFQLGEKDNAPMISGEVKIRNSGLLADALKEYMKKKEKDEASGGGFDALQTITLPKLHYTASAGVNRVIFSGSALLGDNRDSVYQLVAYHGDAGVKTVSCLYCEKADVADFINSIYGKTFFTQGWLKAGDIGVVIRPSKTLPDISRFPRELCNVNVEEDNEKNDAEEKLALFVNDFQLSDCGNKEKVSESCLFLRRVFNGALPVKMVGSMSKSWLELDGYTTKEMALGAHITMKGLKDRDNDMRNDRIHVRIVVNEKLDQIIFQGLIKFGGDTSKDLPCKIVLAADNVLIQIPKSTSTEYLDIIRNDKLQFVQLINTASTKKCISALKPMTTLEMNAVMKLGNADSSSAISFDDQNLIKQFIDPETMGVKFYACRDGKDSMEISDVLKAFGEGKNGVRGLLDNSAIKGLCVTYHEGKGKWSIEDLGLEVDAGLRLSGTLETNLGNDGADKSNMKCEMRIDDGKAVFCVVLPPQAWGVKERTIKTQAGKTVIRVPRMEMYFKEDSQSFGPELCYEFPFVGEHAFGYLTGYIKTIGVETDGEITIKTFETPGNMDNYVFEYSGQLFSEVEGSMKLDGVYLGQNPSKIEFKVKVDVLEYAQKALKTSVVEFTQVKSQNALKYLNKAKEYLANFTKWKKQYEEHRTTLLNERQKNQNQFKKTKIERARSMQAFAKDCSHDCGYVRVPGWIVNEKCGKSSMGRALRCMNYAKDGHVASNVGCVASCEAERVRSLVEARDLNDAAREEGGKVDKNQNCLDLVQDVIQLINIYVEKMSESVAQMEKVTQSHRDLGLFTVDTVDDKVQIDRLDSEAVIDNLDDASCLPFNIDVKVSFDENNDVVKSYTNVRRCFNGMFMRKLVEYIFEDMMKDDIEAMDKFIEAMEEKYASFEKILKKCPKNSMSRKLKKAEDNFNQCIASPGSAPSALRRRSVVQSTLSPLRSSLFTIFRDGTVKSFTQRSPWVIANRRDAFDHMLHNGRKAVVKNITLPENEHPCTAARRATLDYGDIANYIHKWTKEQQSAKRTLSSVHKFLDEDVKKVDDKVGVKMENFTKDEVENMQYWMNKAKTGMSRWLSSESDRIDRHNKESIPLLRKELEFIYTGDQHKTLGEFFTTRGSDGSRALKKAKIETPSSSIFPALSKNLLAILESGKTLEEISAPIEETIKRIDGLEKRTILCTT